MNINLNYSPFFLIKESVCPLTNKQLDIFIPFDSFDVKRVPNLITINNYDQVTELFLQFQGFDSILKSKNGDLSTTGIIDLCVVLKDSSFSIKLCETEVPILSTSKKSFFRSKTKSIPLNIKDISQQIEAMWKDSFYESLNKIQTATPSIPQQQSYFQPPLKKKRLNNNLANFKYITPISILLLVFAILFLGFQYSTQYQGGQATLNQVLNNNTDPKAYVEDQERMLDNAFKDLGIDRNKINNDLSCFTE